ncbi:CDP-glycerol glycerophosphotransferase family protein [Natrarchaeobaculum aegyptiacum]|uniref:Glycosyl/glycerophosphate transferase n=1 Tax=Natrarchaeobaculum aegyptiacum TaxID=745377 RepID=A0A2Z2HUF8_9EURY|nr:CDP-glycerol glycerophosphotransferase family protein [Natrarchaeobaculum aegyptiacum]ARS90812.1 hypothetical protein B1756_14505 [Natrarchaeobaculum aegyptiacum]
MVFVLSLVVPRTDHIWVFMAGEGSRFADNSKYLFLHCDEKADVRNVWIGTDPEIIAEIRNAGHEAYLTRSLRGKYVMLRAGVYFETHGPIAPEYTGTARLVHLTHGNYLKVMLNDHTRDWPWLLEFAVDVFFERRRRYVVTSDGSPMDNMMSMRDVPAERMLVTGFPRNDVLLQDVRGERLGVDQRVLEEYLQVAGNGDVVLYAPTYREAYGERNGTSFAEFDIPFAALNDILADHDAHLFVSPHPATTFDHNLEGYDHVSVLETGGDLYPYLEHCDVLVTDYSGIFYDYLLLDRPMVFYAPDLKAYESDRGLYFDYEDHVPGPVATDSSQFVQSIREAMDGDDRYSDRREHLRDEFYADPDGNASERVVRAVVEWLQ